MNDLSAYIKDELFCRGADIVGFGDLTELPPEIRKGLPVGISVAVKYPKEVIAGIYDLPTQEYFDNYNRLNKKLDMLVTLGAEALRIHGYKAVAQTLDSIEWNNEDFLTLLPHKTVATRAGIGWIGKSALLVTKQYGSMIRLSSILTDAPLKTAKPVNTSKCGGCKICTNACTAGAIKGVNWSVKKQRDEFFNAELCYKETKKRSMQGFGNNKATVCGRCIAVCPYTKEYLNKGQISV